MMHTTPEETYRKNNTRATLVVLALGDETPTLSIRALFETILPRKPYTDSSGALRLFEICNFEDAASFDLAIKKRMLGKLPTTLSIYQVCISFYFIL